MIHKGDGRLRMHRGSVASCGMAIALHHPLNSCLASFTIGAQDAHRACTESHAPCLELRNTGKLMFVDGILTTRETMELSDTAQGSMGIVIAPPDPPPVILAPYRGAASPRAVAAADSSRTSATMRSVPWLPSPHRP